MDEKKVEKKVTEKKVKKKVKTVKKVYKKIAKKKKIDKRVININTLFKSKNSLFPLPNNPVVPFDPNNYQHLNDVSNIVDKIKNIVYKPRTHIIANKESKKIETAIRIDNSDLRETAQREKLWRERNNEAVPERIFSDVYDIDFAIYENRFILTLINKMFNFVNSELRSLYTYVNCISNNYQIRDIYITSAVDILRLSNVNLPSYGISKKLKRKSFLTKNELPLFETIKKLLLIRKSLTHIIASKFYKIVKQAKPLGEKDIHPTNVLVGDPTYAPCYSFYIKLNKRMSVVKRSNKINRINYSNYVISCLLRDLKKLKFKFTSKRIPVIKNEMQLTNFRVSNDSFKLLINSKAMHIDLIFKISLKNKTFKRSHNQLGKTVNKVSLDILPNVSTSLSTILIDAIISKRLENGYNNAFVVTSQAISTSFDVIICSPYASKLDSNILNMLKSMMLITEGDEFIYAHLCPVCGNPITVDEENGNYVCPLCASTYSIIPTKAKKSNPFNIVWIKRIKTK